MSRASHDPHGNIHGNCQTTIDSLRAEVERLTKKVSVTVEDAIKAARERDEALAEVKRLSEVRADLTHDLERALAQVAVLSMIPNVPNVWFENLPTKAHALLDRLQALQRIVDSLKPLQARLSGHPLRGENDNLAETAIKVTDRLQLAEAVVEAVKTWQVYAQQGSPDSLVTEEVNLLKALAEYEKCQTNTQ